jgi:hypothetical protein
MTISYSLLCSQEEFEVVGGIGLVVSTRPSRGPRITVLSTSPLYIRNAPMNMIVTV